jgi:hypothetical protein
LASSLEKVRAFAEQMIAEKLNPATAAMLAPMLTLPDTDAECDDELERYARLCCELRSDDAPHLQVSYA